MPIYEYECVEHGRFSVTQPMFAEKLASCPECRNPAEFRISLSNFRFAEPITVLQDLGNYPDGTSKGYKELDWKPDSGISPPSGQAYKTGKEVAEEEHGGLKEV